MMSEGVLAATIREALRARASQRAEGATPAELDASLEKTLRVSWPFTREWHFLCERCRDYGLEIFDCPGDATCGRTKPHLPHEYGVACWCSVGQRYRAKEKTEESAIAQAAKAKPMSRFGR